jgi:hypothetical protein
MTLPRRQFLQFAGAAVATVAFSRVAMAQGYPTRPITTIVPCMGFQLSSGFRTASGSLFFLCASSLSLFDPEITFLRPDPQYCKAGARRSCQGWPSHQPFHELCPCQAIP